MRVKKLVETTRSTFRFFRFQVWRILRIQQGGLLVYVGANKGHSLEKILFDFERVIAIEAHPDLAAIAMSRLRKYSHTSVYQFGASDIDGWAELKIPSNGNHDGSSTLDFYTENRDVRQIDKIEVETKHLGNFLESMGVGKIRLYVSDCEGYDLKILRTLSPWLDKGLISEIQCEVQLDDTAPAFQSVRNQEKDFDALLDEKYRKVARGWGNLKSGSFREPPDDWFFWDVKWEIRQSK